MTRFEQNAWFLDAVIKLLAFAQQRGIPIRGGEWQRPDLLARIYSTGIDLVNRGLRLFSNKTGVLKSDHTQSLALDLLITDLTGKGILYKDDRYALLGEFWISIGGYWFSADPFHFEIKGVPV